MGRRTVRALVVFALGTASPLGAVNTAAAAPDVRTPLDVSAAQCVAGGGFPGPSPVSLRDRICWGGKYSGESITDPSFPPLVNGS